MCFIKCTGVRLHYCVFEEKLYGSSNCIVCGWVFQSMKCAHSYWSNWLNSVWKSKSMHLAGLMYSSRWNCTSLLGVCSLHPHYPKGGLSGVLKETISAYNLYFFLVLFPKAHLKYKIKIQYFKLKWQIQRKVPVSLLRKEKILTKTLVSYGGW